MDVPEMAARLSAYLGERYGPEISGGTAAIPMPDMHPLVANVLGIDPTRALTIEEMTNLLAGYRVDGEPIPGKAIQRSTADKVRLAYTDFTFSAPKSFSIALVFAETEVERTKLETCWMRANDALMKHIESHIGGARQGAGGRDGVVPGHMAIVQYNHYSARPTVMLADGDDTRLATVPQGSDLRPGDMQRHTHNIFMHVTVTDDGQVKSPNLDETRERMHEFGAIGHAYLATYLREAGVRAEIDPRTGLSYLPDIPEAMVDLFSSRRASEGEASARRFAAEKGLDWDRLSPKDRVNLIDGEVRRSRHEKQKGPADYEAWKKTADEAGYEHKSIMDPDRGHGLAPASERTKVAWDASLPMLEDEWKRRAVLDGSTLRIMAARGLIAAGIDKPSDVDAVIEAYRTEGVRQSGRMTGLIEGREHGKRFASASTALHVAEEREAISILKAAAEDKSGARTHAEIDAAAARVSARLGLDFTTEQGRKQLAMSHVLGTSGRAAVGIGVAGAGKTGPIAIVVDAHHHAGGESIGVTLAWRQTHGLTYAGVGRNRRSGEIEPDTDRLTNAGIEKSSAFAMTPFLNAVADGHIKPTEKTLIVVDEVATIGTHQILQLARILRDTGAKLAAVGDDRQCQAIDAGATINLFRRALGSDQVPELLDTVRQKRIEDRETADLFRKGKAAEAVGAEGRGRDAAAGAGVIP